MMIAAHVFALAQFLAAMLPSQDDLPLVDEKVSVRWGNRKDPVLDA